MPADPSTRWLFIIVASLTILYFGFIRGRRKRKDPLERSGALSLSQQRAVEREMSNLLVEYEEMIRRMTAQVETRATKLEMLIRDADEKLARLERFQGMIAGSDGAATSRAAPATDADARDAATTIVRVEQDTPLDPRHAAVYDLADQGRTAPQIAQQLSRPRGEIDLILALRGSMRG